MTPAPELARFVPGHVLARLEREDGLWSEVDGTLCFIDISGFTALSERLAAKGRVGAEELTEVLSRVFGTMLDLVAVRGGTLLKFGGDALLLLFEGPDHATQASSAAVEMRAALRKAADVPTSVGKVALRMSVGLHSGSVHLFTLAGTHRELIVAGPASSRVNLMEGTADAGEIVISEATRALLPPDAATVPKGEGWILRWRTPKVTACGVPAFHDEDPTEPERYLSSGLRDHLGGGALDSEHRLATVLFVKVFGVDDRLASDGADATSRALQQLIAGVTRIADDEEVTFLATDVDANSFKIILVAGVPTTSLDEDGKALRTARAIADLDTPFDLKLGVNRGHVFSGEVGTSSRSTFTIMGDTVNLAARLMAAAPAGAVYVTPHVVDGSTTLFATEPVPPFFVKGKSQPVNALALGDETGTRTARETRTVSFVARVSELERLREAVRLVEGGTGSAMAVSGPTGIGKTRIVEEAVDASPIETIEVRAEPYGAANPYRPFRDPARNLLGIDRGSNDAMAKQFLGSLQDAAPDLVPFAPLLADIVQVEVPDTDVSRAIEPRFRLDRTVDAFVALLETIHGEPLILVGEDMHWADPASEALIARLAKEAHAHPWLVIQTCRNVIQQEAVETIVLEPFTSDETRELVHVATEAAPLRPDIEDAIVERSSGSPLFALELVKVARDTGDVASLPTSLDGVVGSQIDSLEPLPRRVLGYLSVLGRSFRVPVARELLESQGVRLDEATRERLAEFLEEDGPGRLQFRHAMVRDTAYEGLSFRRRRVLHLEAGQMVLDSTPGPKDGVADILGLHFHLGGDNALAWEYCRLAGDRMMERYANVEAAAQFERALESARRLDVADRERAEVWAKLGDVRERAGQLDAAVEAYRHGFRIIGDDALSRSDLLLKRAWVRYQAGNYPVALRESTQANRLVEGLAPTDVDRVSARAKAFRAVVRSRQGKLTEAVDEATHAAAMAERSDERTALARAYNVLAWSMMVTGNPATVERCQEALALYEELGDLVGQNDMNANLGVLAYFAGQWDEALEYYERSSEGAKRVGNVVDGAFFETNIGELLVNQRRYDAAEDRLKRAVRVLRATGEASMATFAEMLIARVFLERGELDRSADVLRGVIDEATEIGYPSVTVEASLHLADLELRRGDTEAASALLAGAMAGGGEAAEEFALLEQRIHARCIAQGGDPTEAIRILDEALDAADEGDYDTAMLLETKSEILASLDPDAAADDAERAAAIMARARHPHGDDDPSVERENGPPAGGPFASVGVG